MTISVFKLEPECLTYRTSIDAEYLSHQPEYLEQVNVLRGTLDALQEKAEQDNLNNWIQTNRRVRTGFKEKRELEGDDVDSGSTRGE